MCNSDGMNELIGKIHLGDCMEVLRGLPDKCVDLLLTDPPYGTGGVTTRHCATAAAGASIRTGQRSVERTGGTWATKYKKKFMIGTLPRVRRFSLSCSV